jgi:hypothetical protein
MYVLLEEKRQKIYTMYLRFYLVKKNTVFLPKNKLALTHVTIGHFQFQMSTKTLPNIKFCLSQHFFLVVYSIREDVC